MAFGLGALAIGSLLGSGGGGSSSTSSSQLTNSLAFNPTINIGGAVNGSGGDASAEPSSTVITDQTDGKASGLGFGSLDTGGYSNFDSASTAGFGGGDLTMPLLIGGAVLAFFMFTGKAK